VTLGLQKQSRQAEKVSLERLQVLVGPGIVGPAPSFLLFIWEERYC
jgi:hypothetical protein